MERSADSIKGLLTGLQQELRNTEEDIQKSNATINGLKSFNSESPKRYLKDETLKLQVLETKKQFLEQKMANLK